MRNAPLVRVGSECWDEWRGPDQTLRLLKLAQTMGEQKNKNKNIRISLIFIFTAA